eukprot:scaffold804_cov85-Skeletonema_dohrnii-CCMP3373.AAC.7
MLLQGMQGQCEAPQNPSNLSTHHVKKKQMDTSHQHVANRTEILRWSTVAYYAFFGRTFV